MPRVVPTACKLQCDSAGARGQQHAGLSAVAARRLFDGTRSKDVFSSTTFLTLASMTAAESSDHRTRDQVCEDIFLDARAKLLSVAAMMDRIDEAEGDLSARSSETVEKLRKAIAMCGETQGGRAEQLQHLFSRPYDAEWRRQMDLQPRQQTPARSAR